MKKKNYTQEADGLAVAVAVAVTVDGVQLLIKGSELFWQKFAYGSHEL